MNNVTMVCGFPASGKSSLVKRLLNNNPNSIVLNRDTEGGKIKDLLPKMDSLLSDNKSIILDNLFTTAESRKPFIDIAKKHNLSIDVELMDTSIEDCTYNAVLRAFSLLGEFPSPEVIKKANHPNIFPPAVLFKARKEFQKPSLEEGFSKININKFERVIDSLFVNKAIITDYDGCVRTMVGGNGKFPVKKEEIKINEKCINVLKHYKEQGYLLLGISNQSGVAKGDLTYEQANDLFIYTNSMLELDIEYKFCPHRSAPISCYCRKPQCGFGVEFILKYKLDPKKCLFIGDMTTDKTFATRCGFKYMDQSNFYL